MKLQLTPEEPPRLRVIGERSELHGFCAAVGVVGIELKWERLAHPDLDTEAVEELCGDASNVTGTPSAANRNVEEFSFITDPDHQPAMAAVAEFMADKYLSAMLIQQAQKGLFGGVEDPFYRGTPSVNHWQELSAELRQPLDASSVEVQPETLPQPGAFPILAPDFTQSGN